MAELLDHPVFMRLRAKIEGNMVKDEGGQPQVSFVVPCYNESAHLSDTVSEIETAVREANLLRHEIIVVDDRSTDNTLAIANQLAALNLNIVVITNPKNLGFGGAYKAGLKQARGVYVTMIPGDNAYPSNNISSLLHKADAADIIIPYVENPEARSFSRQIISRAFVHVVNFVFGLSVPQYNGAVMYKTDLVRSIEIKTDGFFFQAEAIIRLLSAGANYTTASVRIVERKHAATTAFRPKNIYRVVKSIVALWYELRVRPKFATVFRPSL
jgi:glycosyltransferase involved in cell wall biosynthesis